MSNSIKTDLTSLNKEQVDAVISDDKRLLVLAGAGSGKTKTLIQKLIYLTEDKGVHPSNVLAITFTKNATNEMVDRLILAADHSGEYERILGDKRLKAGEKINERNRFIKKFKWISNFTVRTFHSLCYSILKTHGVKEFDNKFKILFESKATEEDFNPTLATETIFEVFDKLLIELCSDKQYLLDLKRYILDYVVDKIHKADYTRKLHSGERCYTTLRGEKVWSKSEQYIADWLFRHSIKYEYEPLVHFDKFPFKPDFFIPEANVFIEHVTDKSYAMKDKEEEFKSAGYTCFQTYERMANNTNHFNMALDRIVRNRLPANYEADTVLNYLEEFKSYMNHVNEFLRQVMRVTDMIKVEQLSVENIREKAANEQHERVRDFYKLALPLIEKYQGYCVNKSYLDFNDLISRTILLFKNYPEVAEIYKRKFTHVLVDEFQDVNNLQVELIKLMITEETQLFCVGDDWQSIYGFRGSNVSYIVNFEHHFKNARTIKLNLNYRSTEHIVDASNEVIRNNKFKVDKDVKASKRSPQKIEIFTGFTEDDNVAYAVQKVKDLLDSGISGDDILFLYRRSKMYYEYFNAFKKLGLFVSGKTIHGSKGLEAKAVFIIGLTDGSGGFPDIWLEDRIFQIIKESDFDLLMEEERRLFYVALTRAKDLLYLITIKGSESSFLKEIPQHYTVKVSQSMKAVVEKIILCKKCESALDNKLFAFCPYCGEKQTGS